MGFPPNAESDQSVVDLVISSTNPQHADLIGGIHLVAQLSVNDELVEEVECRKLIIEGHWRPNFMTDL